MAERISLMFARVWNRLTEPHPSIQAVERRHQAYLLSAMLVGLNALILLAVVIASWLIYRSPNPFGQPLTALGVLSLCVFLLTYRLSRTRHVALAAFILVYGNLLATFASIAVAPEEEALFVFLVLTLQMGSLLFSKRGYVLLFLVTLLGTSSLSLLVPQWAAESAVSAVAVVLMFGAFNFISTRTRERHVRQIESLARETEERVRHGEERAAELSEALVALAALDFDKPAVVRGTDDIFDALAVGVNMLGEELQARVEELRRALAAAEAASRAKSEFLSNVSHELRSPLNAILGFAQLLELEAASLPERSARGARQIVESGRRLLAMIDEILDFARSETYRLKLDLQPVDASASVREVCAQLADSAAEKRLTLTLDLPPHPCRVHADPRRLDQILRTLLRNAIQFTPEGGYVIVECLLISDFGMRISDFGTAIPNPQSAIANPQSNAPQSAIPNPQSNAPQSAIFQVTVRDSGVGIGTEKLARLFEPFSQADASASRAHSGLGLELAFARRLAEMHGGRLRAESGGEGKGSAFILELPI